MNHTPGTDLLSELDINAVKDYLLDLQQRICSGLESEDGSQVFTEDAWEHKKGGGGRTRVLSGGAVFERS